MHLSSSDLLIKSKAPASNSKHIISHNPAVTKPSANAATQKAARERESHCGFRKTKEKWSIQLHSQTLLNEKME